METLNGLKKGDVVSHRSKSEVRMIVTDIVIYIPAKPQIKESDTKIECTWLSSLNEKQVSGFSLFELTRF